MPGRYRRTPADCQPVSSTWIRLPTGWSTAIRFRMGRIDQQALAQADAEGIPGDESGTRYRQHDNFGCIA